VTAGAFLVALLCAAAGAVHAQTTVGVHLASSHVPAQDYQNSFNPGIYVCAENGVIAGVFRNSLGRTSAYAGFVVDAGPYALMVGLATGYQKRAVAMPCNNAGSAGCWQVVGSTNARLVPMVAPSVRLPEVAGVTPRISYVPGLGINASAVHLSVERRF